MPPAVRRYLVVVETVNRAVGRAVVWSIFLLMGLLLWSSAARTLLDTPLVWSVELAQFLLVAYFLLGGGWSMLADAHVRMDLLWARWGGRARAFADTLTAVCLLVYLAVMLVGGIGSTHYALSFDQRNYSAWAPPLAPIKIVIVAGLVLMLLQATAIFLRDLGRLRGWRLPEPPEP